LKTVTNCFNEHYLIGSDCERRAKSSCESTFPLPIVDYSLELPMAFAADLDDATKALVMPKSHSV